MRGPSLAAGAGALLGRRMGGSPKLCKEAAILKEEAFAGKQVACAGSEKPSNARHFGHACRHGARHRHLAPVPQASQRVNTNIGLQGCTAVCARTAQTAQPE